MVNQTKDGHMLMTCIKCKKTFDESMFYKDKSKPSGRKPRCKSCEKLYKDMDKRREYEKQYREKNKERRREIVKRSIEKNKQHHKEKRREYLNTERGRSNHRKHGQTRRAREVDAYVEDVSPIDLFKEQNGICYLCLEKFNFEDMEMDHVIPISRGGLHKASNVKMACKSCNRSKGAKLLEELSYQVV